MIYDPIIPVAWIVCIALAMLGAAAFFQMRSARRLGMMRNLALLLPRLAAIAIIIFLLLQPCREEHVPVPAVEKRVLFAVDTSASMREPHRDGSTRIDAARADLEKSGLFDEAGGRHVFFSIGETAKQLPAAALHLTPATDKNTRMDSSIGGLLKLSGSSQAAGLILLSDGHDFDMVPPVDTARRCRSRDLPVFTIPYGTAQSARDVSIRIANYHPHTFARQSTRLEATLRALGCPHETLRVDLLCDGDKVQSDTFQTDTGSFQPVHFDVVHEKAGEHVYTFRVAPVANERELSNNSATTYLNVISERIRILEIEGTPFWDSTFLRRSFTRNDKFDIDSLVAFTNDRVRPIRSNPERKTEELKPPLKVDDFKPYNIVILGRNVERVIGEAGLNAIDAWVKDQGGIAIFSRGPAWAEALKGPKELEPIEWKTNKPRATRLEVTPQAGGIAAFGLLREVAAADQFPEVIAFPATSAAKTLATTFSVADDQAPAVVYRRYGTGQTLSLGVGNLWRWVFNPKASYDNNAYDRFWDQLTLWLLANGGVSPMQGYTLRPDTSNLPLGETVRLNFGAHGVEAPAVTPAVQLFKDDSPVTTLQFPKNPAGTLKTVEFTPREPGNYKAQMTSPDGKPLVAHFAVYREDMETTDTAMDIEYLAQLAKATGGRMLDASEMRGVVDDLLRGSTSQPPLARRVPLWDQPWIYLLLCSLLGMEWYLRRRWGLT